MKPLRRAAPAFAGALVVLTTLALTACPASAAGCTVQSTTSVSFSAYDVFSASNDLNTAGKVVIVCDKSHPIVITMSTGAGTFAQRKMTGPGGALLNYNLYTTSALTTIWGDGSTGTGTVTGTVATTATSFTIWASIPKNQYTAVAGTYTDSVTASVTP